MSKPESDTAVPPGPGSISTHATGAMTSQKATDGSAAGESPAQSQPAECYAPASAILRMVERAMQGQTP